MKHQSIVTLLALSAISAQGQINMVRYNDNFSYLKGDSLTKHGLEQLKYIPVARLGTISFGGEIREQIQYYHNFNFGDVPTGQRDPGTWQLWHRAMIHTNIEIGKKIILFTQLGSTYRFLNSNPAAPEMDENHLSLHQLFGEYRFNRSWVTRIGRQEISYGSHRLFTFREGPNTRLTFDALIIKHRSERRKIDFIALSPVISRKGVFDDAILKDLIVGAYATEKICPKKLLLDYYTIHFESDRRKFNYASGRDNRNIMGMRAFSEAGLFNYELELTYQVGKFDDLIINAYSATADLNYMLIPRTLNIGVGGNYASGDKKGNDGQLNSYNTLFSKPAFGLTAPIAATNLIAVNPYIRIAPVKAINIYSGTYFMWRQSNHDGSYAPDGTEVRPRFDKPAMTTNKKIGTLLFLETNYSLNHHLSFAFDASHFFAGGFIKETGKGMDITYLSFKVNYKF